MFALLWSSKYLLFESVFWWGLWRWLSEEKYFCASMQTWVLIPSPYAESWALWNPSEAPAFRERQEHIRGSLASRFSQSGRGPVFQDREERKRGTHLRPPHFLAQAYRTTYTCVCICKHVKLKVYFHTIHEVNKVKRRILWIRGTSPRLSC